MTVIGATPPTATRAEPGDIVIGNFIENSPFTTDVTVAGLRRSDADYDTESISNAVRWLTNGNVRGKFANNGDFDINGDAVFVKQSNKFTGFGTTSSANRVGISGGLAVGSGFVGTAAPTNGAIFEGRLGVGTNAVDSILHIKADGFNSLIIDSTTSDAAIDFKSNNVRKFILGYDLSDNVFKISDDFDRNYLVIKDNGTTGSVGMGLLPTANMDGLSIEAGLLTLKETTTPTADANYGKFYTKNDNKAYFQDGAGVEHELAYVP